MTICVDPDWWKTLFDEIYLLTDARSVDNQAITRREVGVIATLLDLKPQDRILDLCGGHGRHALELCRRGFFRCIVLDYSRTLLKIGARDAARKRYPMRFVQADARRTGLGACAFDHVLILGNSLGYLWEPDADLQILQESRRLLKPQGRLLLDVTDGSVARSGISPQAWHEIGNDIVVCRQREVRNGRVFAREMVLSKETGMIRDKTYGIRLYGKEQLADLVLKAGFADVLVHSGASELKCGEDLGCMDQRLLAVARNNDN
jgi:D-alanine-D-alanine ligase